MLSWALDRITSYEDDPADGNALVTAPASCEAAAGAGKAAEQPAQPGEEALPEEREKVLDAIELSNELLSVQEALFSVREETSILRNDLAAAREEARAAEERSQALRTKVAKYIFKHIWL